MKVLTIIYLVVYSIILSQSCKRESTKPSEAGYSTNKDTVTVKVSPYKTKNVVIVVIDGPRYTETWGDSSKQYIPFMAGEMAKEGIVYSKFYNKGFTYTSAGHSAVTTGYYQEIDNTGLEIPIYPSIFQYFLESKKELPYKAWVIASKEKLEILANCRHSMYFNAFNPLTDCGNNGIGTGNRGDSTTFEHTINILQKERPNLVLINFKEPDVSGHNKDWNAYLKGIESSDKYVYLLWKYLQEDIYYKGNTTLFVTNDHGRHLNNVKDGFISHGDECEGCRHINCYAWGPDFKKGIVEDTEREQIDIPTTVAELLGFKIPTSKGKLLKELFLESNLNDDE